MKDRMLLIAGALVCSVLAWSFWHYLGHDALSSMLLLALVSVIADNWRLRRALRQKEIAQ